MIKVLTSEQIREADQYTIKYEPIDSLELMERASRAFINQFLNFFPKKKLIRIFCGTGNNGGDGLAIGRILKSQGWEVFKYIVGNPQKGSEDFKQNLDRSDLYAVIKETKDLPEINEDEIIIDGLFGSGLSRPLDGLYLDIVNFLNESNALRIAIDMPSGLFADRPLDSQNTAFNANITISFQVPKLAFLLPENHQYLGEWYLVDIGLNTKFLEDQSTSFYFTEQLDLKGAIPHRGKFTHKNEIGRLLIVSGSKGKMGAAILCTRAAFAVGARLVNAHTPRCGTQVIQTTIPEAMVIEDVDEEVISKIPNTKDTIAIGPGIGTEPKTVKAFENLLKKTSDPMVIDADGLNIIAKKKSLLKWIPKNSILTPHPGEFKRLVGVWKNDFEKLEKLRKLSIQYEFNIVLKGAYSAVCDSQGKIFFNPTGNPGLATAGSGDVLTGVIASFLSQGVAPFNALQLGVYVHGLAGDIAVNSLDKSFLIASEIIGFLTEAMREIKD
ncbi:MAG: NAD(P)H-hydrate dehydratase [Bacteroidota bacterium]